MSSRRVIWPVTGETCHGLSLLSGLSLLLRLIHITSRWTARLCLSLGTFFSNSYVVKATKQLQKPQELVYGSCRGSGGIRHQEGRISPTQVCHFNHVTLFTRFSPFDKVKVWNPTKPNQQVRMVQLCRQSQLSNSNRVVPILGEKNLFIAHVALHRLVELSGPGE